MGTFHAVAGIENITDRTNGVSIPRMLVDRGNESTLVPEPTLEKTKVRAGEERLHLCGGKPTENNAQRRLRHYPGGEKHNRR